MSAILSVDGYSLDYVTRAGPVRVLTDISLAIEPGEVLGVVGESGSGKSSLAFALLRYLPDNAHEISGTLRLRSTDLRALAPKQLTTIRGGRIGMVFQDPSTALNPTLTIGRQMTEALTQHRRLAGRAAEALALELLDQVELRDPSAILRRYPHQISGGEKQRVIIATALGCRPDVVIFDEPTTALDVITGARILELFARLRAETEVAALYISHDLALVSRVADRVAVLKRGALVEVAPAGRIFRSPGHADTKALVDAVPRPERRLVHDRADDTTLFEARDIEVRYARPRLFHGAPSPATHKVSIDLHGREILGLVGESGSGKSSIARALTGLVDFSGEITLQGRTIAGANGMDAAYRRDLQIIFQHPDASLNPRQRVGEILSRPLKLFGGEMSEIPKLLDQVRLPASHASRWPHQLSGGEKQRVAIARAFAARPKLVICDEITASLDVSVQSQIIDLLLALRAESGTAYLFITHDLNLIRQIAHRVAVMRHGAVVDVVAVEALGASGNHAYTRELIAATPTPVG
jgi:peptide/nickel transport system ATP-binding protein